MSAHDKTEDIRVDKWIWAARFFKIRKLASEAVKAGHIEINGVRCKASKNVQIGDTLHIRKENESFTVVVTGLADKRGSATIAATLYQETDESLKQREQAAEQRKWKTLHAPAPEKRPDKRDRRKIKAYKGSL